ncbi:hypothetical protein Q5O14_05420 [Eubacteriaceae bacterium ES2]|nr:hypothetical protein Q5O14_05420 [Eubacteriaceae bacterium ES2]
MRITYRMMTNKYTDNLNKQATELDRLNTQVSTGRAFSRTSEDTSTAIRAYQIRKNISKVENYQTNIEFSQDFLTNTESTLSSIEGSLSDAMEKILSGVNGTNAESERAIIAEEIRTIQEQILESLNTSVSDTYIYGGGNTTTKPFTVDSTTGKLFYNGVDLDTLLDDGSDTTYNELAADSLYVDIGLGVEFDASGDVERTTVFNYSVTGVSFTGVGTTTLSDGTTVSNNIYNLLGEIADEFDKDDATYSQDRVENLYGLFTDSKQSAYQKTTEIGAKTNYLEFMTERYDTQLLNLQERQTNIEGIDTAEAYITYSTQQVAYQAALQMGTEIIQQSVFDYMS